jgi:hypothetical protein
MDAASLIYGLGDVDCAVWIMGVREGEVKAARNRYTRNRDPVVWIWMGFGIGIKREWSVWAWAWASGRFVCNERLLGGY